MENLKYYSVLTVEDESLLLKSINDIINNSNIGFRVDFSAGNGQEAINIMNENNVHLIITDIRMPIMSGLELLEYVKNNFPKILVILLTSYAEFQYAQEALRLGALDYILKPVSEEKLETALLKAEIQLKEYYKLIEEELSINQSSENAIAYAKEYIETYFAEDINISNLAKKLGFTSAYFSKLFNTYENCAPSKYLTNIRINSAKNLLANTQLHINEVGRSVGYDNQFYFSRIFKNNTGYTPSAYRNKYQK